MMRALLILLVAFACLGQATSLASAVTIGLSLPLSGRAAPIAQQIKTGAELAILDMQNAGQDIDLVIADDACTAKDATTKAQNLTESAIVVGPLCFDTAVALTSALNPHGETPLRPVIAFGTRSTLLKRARNHDKLPLYAIAKKPTAEAEAFVQFVLPQFAGKPFAIVDDGSLHGRSLADDIRLLGEQAGFKPVMVANFRPLQTNQRTLLRRLRRSGVQAVILAAAPEDVITIVRDVTDLKLAWPIAIGEQAELLSFADGAGQLTGDILAIAKRDPVVTDETLFSSLPEELNPAARMSVMHGYALVEIAARAANGGITDLRLQTFETKLGSITFGEDGRADLAPFELFRWSGGELAPMEGN